MESSSPDLVQSQGNSRSRQGAKRAGKEQSDERGFILHHLQKGQEWSPEVKGKAMVRRTQANSSHKSVTETETVTVTENRSVYFPTEKKPELLVTIAERELEAHHLRLRDRKREKAGVWVPGKLQRLTDTLRNLERAKRILKRWNGSNCSEFSLSFYKVKNHDGFKEHYFYTHQMDFKVSQENEVCSYVHMYSFKPPRGTTVSALIK